MSANVLDTFGRTLSGSIGTADSGQAWTYTGTSGSVSVDGSKVVLAPSGGETNTALIEDGIANVDVICDFSVSNQSVGDPLVDSETFSIVAGADVAGDFYVARWSSLPGAAPTIAVGIRSGGTLNLFGNAQPLAFAWVDGAVWRIKLHIQGGDIFAKAWPVAVGEPSGWDAVGVEQVRSLPMGSVGFRMFTSAGLTNTPTFTVDNFTATILPPPRIPLADRAGRQRILLGMRSIPTSGGTTPEQDYAATIGARETLMGRKVDIVMTFRNWDIATEDMTTEESLVADGRIPMVSWPLGATTPGDAVAGTIAGTYDSIITAWATWAAAQPGEIWFRLVWEMNADPIWGPDPAAFVTAWQHIYTLFQNADAINVKFLWAPNHRTTSGVNQLWDLYYPGEDFVHLIGIDSYNKNPPTQFFNQLVTTGDFLQLTANHNWYSIYRQRRRSDGTVIELVLAETGSREQIDPFNTNPQTMTKADWIADLQQAVKGFPSIAAVLYFDVDAPAGDYRIDTTPTGGIDDTLSNPTLTAWLRLVADPYWGGVPLVPPPPPIIPTLPLTTALGGGGYQVWLATRGRGQYLGLINGWTQLTWDVRRSDIGQAQLSFSDIGSASDDCQRLFRAATKWAHELVIVRPDGFEWSGPIIGRASQGGTGVITAAQVSQWGLVRKIHNTHKITKGDATDAYERLWHDAVDPDNTMGWQLVITSLFGDVIPIDIKSSDRVMFNDAVQPIMEGGLDTVTVDRVTYVGPPDTQKIPTILTDQHVMILPDFTEDGMQQATDLGVIGQTNGDGAPPYGEAENGFAASLGLIEMVIQSTTAKNQRQAQREAVQGIQTRTMANPVLSQITLKAHSPFTIPMLQPGRLWDVRMKLTPVPISDTYRIAKVQCTVSASQAGGEQIQVDVDQSNVAT